MNDDDPDGPIKEIAGYKIKKYINSGLSGDVFEAERSGIKYALKIAKKEKLEYSNNSILYEFSVYNDLYGMMGICKPILIRYGRRNILVMDLLDKNLREITVNISMLVKVSIDILNIIQLIHEHGYIHGDIKPSNFMVDKTGKNVYCIDFGLARKYLINDKHVKFEKLPIFKGNYRYASYTASDKYTQSRKDDLISIGYLLVYLWKGSLPWSNAKSKKQINYMKSTISIKKLCSGLSEKFILFFEYVNGLNFEETPNYEYLRSLFKLMESYLLKVSPTSTITVSPDNTLFGLFR